MKCKYLLKLEPSKFEFGNKETKKQNSMTQIYFNVVTSILCESKDIVICKATIKECPKKKQPCEINARCWRLGC